MSDLQTCLASFAIVVGAMDQSGVENAERHIDLYLTTCRDDARVALLTLKTAFEDMRLDGQLATHIHSSIDRRLSGLEIDLAHLR